MGKTEDLTKWRVEVQSRKDQEWQSISNQGSATYLSDVDWNQPDVELPRKNPQTAKHQRLDSPISEATVMERGAGGVLWWARWA